MATWRVGVLFSRSGATAVSETEHFLGTALVIEELNNASACNSRLLKLNRDCKKIVMRAQSFRLAAVT
jgi:hypothetical protein